SKEYPHVRAHEFDFGLARAGLAKLATNRGDFAAARRDYEEAVGHFRRCLEDSPDYAHGRSDLGNSFNGLANAWFRLGEHAKAEQACREGILELQKLPPGSPWAAGRALEAIARHDFLVQILEKSGQDEKVAQVYRQVIDLCNKLAADHPKFAEDF